MSRFCVSYDFSFHSYHFHIPSPCEESVRCEEQGAPAVGGGRLLRMRWEQSLSVCRCWGHPRADPLASSTLCLECSPVWGSPPRLREVCMTCPGCWHLWLPQGLILAPRKPHQRREKTKSHRGLVAKVAGGELSFQGASRPCPPRLPPPSPPTPEITGACLCFQSVTFTPL